MNARNLAMRPREQRCRAGTLWAALSAFSIALVLPAASWADDSGVPLLTLAGLEFTEIALDDAALAEIRGEGLEFSGPTGMGEDRTAVILWDEESPGGAGSQQSIQVGSFNGDSAGSTSSAAGR